MEIFSLKWKNFQSNVSKSFQTLRYEEDYSDVTLMGDDFQPLKAHKVVLSSCSEYLKNVLFHTRKYSPHPVLCMEGLSKHDLTNILDYIYNGEIQLYQEELDRFMTIARRFKLDGLIRPGTEIDEKPWDIPLQNELGSIAELNTVSYITSERETEPSTGSHKPWDIPTQHEIEPNSEPNIVSDIISETKPKPDTVSHKQEIVLLPSEHKHKLNEKLEEYFTLEITGMYTCNVCPKVAKHKSHMKEHVETHVDGLKFQCKLCDKSYKQGSTLRSHIAKFHKLKKEEVEFQASQGFLPK